MSKPQRERLPAGTPDRSVFLPFTTPLLAGTRARSRAGSGFELLVPNPAGARGFYVMDPVALRSFCPLTVYDELLLEEVFALGALTPSSVRRAARKVALTGAAGRDAAEAAAKATSGEDAAVRLAHVSLLLRTMEVAGVGDFDPKRLDAADGDTRSYLRSKLGDFASRIGMRVDALLDALEEIAPHVSDVGLPAQGFEGRHPRTLRRLADMAGSLERWAAVESEEIARLARKIAGAARHTCEAGEAAVATARALLEDVPRLLRLWRDSRGEVERQLGFCDWLLDGWIEICGLWEASARDGRSLQRATLNQIERLLAGADAEVRSRQVEAADREKDGSGRAVKPYEDWRTGVVVSDWLERREALKAGALA